MGKPLLSVYIISYNHRSYIELAIESVLMQKVNFTWEIVIADDCSIDGTREIIERYANQYPDIIRTIFQPVNVGPTENWIELLKNLRGKYVACLDGDDYWTNPLKLQKQVDFLEANPDFTICFHRAEFRYDDDNIPSKLSNENQKEITTFEDLANGNYISTLTCVYRNGLFEEFPEWIYQLKLSDWLLHLLNAQYGKIKFLDETMAIYRHHSQGVWTLKSSKFHMNSMATAVELMQKYFSPRGEKEFKKYGSYLLSELCYTAFEEGSYDEGKNYCQRAIKLSKYLTVRKKLSLWIRYFLCYVPYVANLYKVILKIVS